MALEIQSIGQNPFNQGISPKIQGQTKVPYHHEGSPRIGWQQALGGFHLPEQINLDPTVSCLRGAALTNMPLGNEALYGTVGSKLNTIV